MNQTANSIEFACGCLCDVSQHPKLELHWKSPLQQKMADWLIILIAKTHGGKEVFCLAPIGRCQSRHFFGILHHAQESSNLRYLDLIAEGDMHWPFQSIAREVDLDNHWAALDKEPEPNSRQHPIKSSTWSTSGEQSVSRPARAGRGSPVGIRRVREIAGRDAGSTRFIWRRARPVMGATSP
jgi:hypothetical protein